MTKLEKLEQSVAALPDDQLKKFASWFDRLRWERWDNQIEEDQEAGRLDSFLAEARADIANGKTKSL